MAFVTPDVVPGQVGVGTTPPPLEIVLAVEGKPPAPRYVEAGATSLQLEAKFAITPPPGGGMVRWTVTPNGGEAQVTEIPWDGVFEVQLPAEPQLDALSIVCEHVPDPDATPVAPDASPDDAESDATPGDAESAASPDDAGAADEATGAGPKLQTTLVITVYRLSFDPPTLEVLPDQGLMFKASLEPEALMELAGTFAVTPPPEDAAATVQGMLGKTPKFNAVPIRPKRKKDYPRDGHFDKSEVLGCTDLLEAWYLVVRDDQSVSYTHQGNLLATPQPEASRRFYVKGKTVGSVDLPLSYTPPAESGVPTLHAAVTVQVVTPPLAIQALGGGPASQIVRKDATLTFEAALRDAVDGTFAWTKTGQQVTFPEVEGDTASGGSVDVKGEQVSALDAVRLQCAFTPTGAGQPPLTAELLLTVCELTIAPSSFEGYAGEAVWLGAELLPYKLAERGRFVWDLGPLVPRALNCVKMRQSGTHLKAKTGPATWPDPVPKDHPIPLDGEERPPRVAAIYKGRDGYTYRGNLQPGLQSGPADASRFFELTPTAPNTYPISCSFQPDGEGAPAIAAAAPATITCLPPSLKLVNATGDALSPFASAGEVFIVQACMDPANTDTSLSGQGQVTWSFDPARFEALQGLSIMRLTETKWLKHEATGANNDRFSPDLRKDDVVAYEPAVTAYLKVYRGGDVGYVRRGAGVETFATVINHPTAGRFAVLRAKNAPGSATLEASYTVNGETYSVPTEVSIVGVEIVAEDDSTPPEHLLVDEETVLKLRRTPDVAGSYTWSVSGGALEIVGGGSAETVRLRGKTPCSSADAPVAVRCTFKPQGTNHSFVAPPHSLLVSEVVFAEPPSAWLAVGKSAQLELLTRPGVVPGAFTWELDASPGLVDLTISGERGQATLAGVAVCEENAVSLRARFTKEGATAPVERSHRLTVVGLRLVERQGTTTQDPPLLLQLAQEVTLEVEGEWESEFVWTLEGDKLQFEPDPSVTQHVGAQVQLSATEESTLEGDATIVCELQSDPDVRAELKVTVAELLIVSQAELDAESYDQSQPVELPLFEESTLVAHVPSTHLEGTAAWSGDPLALAPNAQTGAITPGVPEEGTVHCEFTTSGGRVYRAQRAAKAFLGPSSLSFEAVAGTYTSPGVGAWNSTTNTATTPHVFGYPCATELGLRRNAAGEGASHGSLDAYYTAVDSLYATRDASLPRTDKQKALLAMAREAARNPAYWSQVRAYNATSAAAKLDWSTAPIVSANGTVKLDAVLQNRVVKLHVFLVASGLLKEEGKVTKVGSASGLRLPRTAHRFCVQFRIMTNHPSKAGMIENFKAMYDDANHRNAGDITDLDKFVWAKASHFVNASGTVVTDMAQVHAHKTWAKIKAYVSALDVGRNNKTDKAANGYLRTSPYRLPNTTSGGISNHCGGFAFDYSRFGANAVAPDDPIHDYVAWEFGLVRCVATENWHFTRTNRPTDAQESALGDALQAFLPL